MDRVAPFNLQQLTSIARIMAETNTGLTGSQIENLLRDCRIPDITPDQTKWKRLLHAFVDFQNKKQFGNHVVVFINKAMNPVQYTATPDVFDSRRDELNTALAFCGMWVGEDGRVRKGTMARSLTDAQNRANRLKSALTNRRVHDDVLKFCRAEFLQKNYFHAVFEAMKSIAAKIRSLSGLTSDGADLVHRAFGMPNDTRPLIAINSLTSDTEKGEQRGFTNLLVGLFGTIRNPLAHNPKIEWDMSEQDALDILTMASLVHRKIDKAVSLSNRQ